MSDLEKLGLRGPVKTVTEVAVQAAPDQNEPEQRQTASYEFDQQGRAIRMTGAAGTTEWTSVNTYDSNGRFLKSVSTSAGRVYHETNYTYQPDGRLLQYISEGDQGRIEAKCSYNERGRKTVVHVFDQVALDRTRRNAFAGSPWSAAVSGHGVPDGGRVRMEFDERDEPLEAVIVSVDNQIIQRISRGYDNVGRLVEEKQVIENPEFLVPAGIRAQMLLKSRGTLAELRERLSKFFGASEGMTRVSYVYDSQGRQVERRTVRAPFFEEVKATRYNEQGEGIEESTITTGAHGARLDEDGNVVPTVSPLPPPQKSTVLYSYKYDERGNWIEQVATHEGQDGHPKPVMKRTRTITYY